MSHKIYLIDDDEDLLRSFQVILEGNGFEVIFSHDGRDCFMRLKNDKPDLLVLDVMMRTEFEGFELLKELKNHEEYKNLPVILLTGMRDQIGVDLISLVEDKAVFPNVRYQDKPLYAHELIEIIREMLNNE